MSTTKQEIQISSVKLINGGNKGIRISYIKMMEDKNGRMSISKMNEENDRPIVGTELLLKFDEFSEYITGINNIEEGKVTATGITASASKFLLSGTIECFNGNKKSATNTPLITEQDDYEKWDEVQAKVDELYKMVLSHMETEKYMATDRDIVISANKGKEGFDIEAVNNMTEQELTDLATKHLEKIGCVVMNPNEEDMPGGIDGEEVELKDISAGDDKVDMFEAKAEVNKNVEELSEQLHPTTIDIEKESKIKADKELAKKVEADVEAERKSKAKAKEQLAKLKQTQEKLEQSISDDDDFQMPLRKVI